MSDLHNLPGDFWDLQGGVLFLAALSSGHAIFRRWSGQLEQSGIARSSLRTLGYPRRQHLFAQVKGVNIWKIAVGLTVRNDLHKLFECLAVVLNMLNDQCHWVGRDPELIHFFSSRFFFPLLFSAQPVAMGQPLDPLRGLSAHLNEVVGVFFFRTMIPPWEYGVIILFFLSCCFDLEHLVAQVFQVQDGKEGSNDINCP